MGSEWTTLKHPNFWYLMANLECLMVTLKCRTANSEFRMTDLESQRAVFERQRADFEKVMQEVCTQLERASLGSGSEVLRSAVMVSQSLFQLYNKVLIETILEHVVGEDF